MTDIYISGPMRGFDHHNRAAFARADKFLRGLGFITHNPAETVLSRSIQEGYNKDPMAVRNALAEDMIYICCRAGAIAMLPGWERSRGAIAEHATAKACGLEIIYLSGCHHD